MSKVTIELSGDDFGRLLESALRSNNAVGQEAKRLIVAALAGIKLTDQPKQESKPNGPNKYVKRPNSKASRKKLRERMRERSRCKRGPRPRIIDQTGFDAD